MDSLLLRNALCIGTLDDRRTRVAGGDVYVEEGVIRAVGRSLRKKARRTIDASGCVVLPGFINLHHHLFQTLTRNLPPVQNADLFQWLTWLYRKWKGVDPEWVEISSQVGLGELLLTGCTTAVDHFYLFARNQPKDLLDFEIEAAREIGIRFHASRGSMSLGRSQGGLPGDELVQKDADILADCERVAGRHHDPSPFSMTRIVLAPCAPFNVTESLMKETVALARRHGLQMHTHLAETLDEEKFCKARYGVRPFEYVRRLGWEGRDVFFAHAVHLNRSEIGRCARQGTGIAHCPTSNLRLGSGIAPVREMLDAGVAVGLGVDGSASNDSGDMLGELRQAMLVHRIRSGVASMPAEDVLWMATRGAARVLGREKELGSIEPGKAADLAVFDLTGLPYAGAHADPLGALLFCGNSHRARWVIVNGRVVVEEGRLRTVNEADLAARARRKVKKILG